MKKWQKDFINHVSKDNFVGFDKGLKICKSMYLPRKIYKYCFFDENDYSINNLKHNQIYLNSPDNFNDPYDCCISYFFEDVWKDISKVHIENSMNLSDIEQSKILSLLEKGMTIFEIKKKFKYNETIVEEINFIIEDIQDNIEELYMDKLQKNIYRNIKISCFSETHNNILMWAHYAKNHTGFCIEYDITNLDFADFKNELYPLFYKNKPIITFKKAEDIRNLSFFLISMLTKFKHWNYEKEWRFIKLCSKENYFNMPCKPSAVYLGTKISDDNWQKIVQLCKEQSIHCHKMIKRAESYYVQPSISYS